MNVGFIIRRVGFIFNLENIKILRKKMEQQKKKNHCDYSRGRRKEKKIE